MVGFTVFEQAPATLKWAQTARAQAIRIAADPQVQAANLRHGETWFVGVDVLPNAVDGSIDGVPLKGPWRTRIAALNNLWHRAQVSIVYPGYPRQDPDESDANHRYRITRHAAHVDGLLPMGPERRRYLREPHAFIVGLPLNRSDAAPLMIWPGSHRIMGDAFRDCVGAAAPEEVDLTETYHAARRVVFDQISPEPLQASPGQAIVLHRHLLHGVAPWAEGATAPPEGRMIAYFRPEFTPREWLAPDI